MMEKKYFVVVMKETVKRTRGGEMSKSNMCRSRKRTGSALTRKPRNGLEEAPRGNIQCGSLLGEKMKRGDGKPNFPEQRLKAGGETKGTRFPLDADPLFHLWLLQVSITCF